MKIRIHFGKNLLLRGFFQICLISLLTIDTHLLLAESPIEPAHQNPEKLPAPQNYQLSQSD